MIFDDIEKMEILSMSSEYLHALNDQGQKYLTTSLVNA